ncbi:unnamed protein product [Mytilus edulis]|uniref:Ig-like domain-containing protein n=1 Tax=Mytilus edulis TaxID=6550 RepID=A0A8S3Q216_MYTED|nr:unnamed protein product [Mytilus edulis]
MERSNFVAILMDPFYKSWEGYYTCTVKENTATHKTWTTDPVYLKSPINESNTGTCVTFPSITREDQGQYVCVADNGIRKTNKTANPIYVRTFKPAIKYANPTAGVITLRQDEVNYNTLKETNMEYKEMAVIVEGYPDPHVTWWKINENGRERLPEDSSSYWDRGFEFYSESIRNDESFYPDEGSKSIRLRIYNVSPVDLGTYVVKAENQLGTAELTFTMKRKIL